MRMLKRALRPATGAGGRTQYRGRKFPDPEQGGWRHAVAGEPPRAVAGLPRSLQYQSQRRAIEADLPGGAADRLPSYQNPPPAAPEMRVGGPARGAAFPPRPAVVRTGAGRELQGRSGPYDPRHASRSERLAEFPAAGKYIADDPRLRAGLAGASADWLDGKGLPVAMRAANRSIVGSAKGPGKRTVFGEVQTTPDSVQVDDINQIWNTASDVEKEVAIFDMNQAILRESTNPLARPTAALRTRMAQNPNAEGVIRSVYIQANRIRAMQEMLEQWGHGGQRRLHDISGMLYQRSQSLAKALQTQGAGAFNAELREWEHMDKFLNRFGREALGLLGMMAGGRALFGEQPPVAEDFL